MKVFDIFLFEKKPAEKGPDPAQGEMGFSLFKRLQYAGTSVETGASRPWLASKSQPGGNG